MHKTLHSLIFAIFMISMFLLTPLNQVVSAETVEKTRVVNISTDPNTQYTSTLNIINISNSQYTNEEILIKAFEDKTGVVGMISGSFLPPAKFQLSNDIIFGEAQHNDHLVLASTVQFQKKNLLSGASSSWWRCPYYYNSSITASRDFSVRLSIYHTDLPRTVNLTTAIADSYNIVNNKIPQSISHPSLVYQQTYLNCGNTNNTNQTFIEVSNTMPVNDTLVNPDLPLNLTADHSNPDPGFWDPAYNPYANYVTLNYAHAWFNVSAPIYPNSTYFVVWDIQDVNIGVDNAASCWITATDIGQDNYGRFLMSWNSVVYRGSNVLEYPIDLDINVVFQIGLGAGVTGSEALEYSNANKISYMPGGSIPMFTNPSFEYSTPGTLYDDNISSMLYTTLYPPAPMFGTNLITQTTSISGNDGFINYYGTYCGSLVQSNQPAGWPPVSGGTDGWNAGGWSEMRLLAPTVHKFNIKIDVTLHNIEIEPPYAYPGGSKAYGCQFKVGILSTTRDIINIVFQRASIIVNGISTFNNYIFYEQRETLFTYHWEAVRLPDDLPEDLYITLQTKGWDPFLDPPGEWDPFQAVVLIYGQDNPNVLISATRIGPISDTTISPVSGFVFSGCAASSYELGVYKTILAVGEPIITIRKITGVRSLDYVPYETGLRSIWQIDSSSTAWPSKVNFGSGMETTAPQTVSTGLPNTWKTQSFSFIQTTPNETFGNVFQTTNNMPIPVSNRLYFAECTFRLTRDSIANFYSILGLGYQSYFKLVLYGIRNDGTYTYIENSFYLEDADWHTISIGPLNGRFKILQINCAVYFPYTLGTRVAFIDNINIYSIEQPYKAQLFSQELDKNGWNSTNYYTIMIPFKLNTTYTTSMSPFATLEFKSISGITVYTTYTTPTDFNNDYIIYSIRTQLIPTTAIYVTIHLCVFDDGMYLFLYDRNQQFTINNASDTKFNTFEEYAQYLGGTIHPLTKTFFSPYYSFKTTAGQWINADSIFTTTYFYYIKINFISFNDNDYEIVSIIINSVDANELREYKLSIQTFGHVYTATEWASFLEFGPSWVFDKIMDYYAALGEFLRNNTGGFIYNIGLSIYEMFTFFVALIESLVFFIIEAIEFIAAIVIFIISTWVMWNFVRFWILVGQNRVEEGLEVLGNMTAKVQAGIQSVAGGVTGVIKKIGTGGMG